MRRMRLKTLVAGVCAGAGALASKDAAALCPAQFPAPGFERQIAITVDNPGSARGETFVLATVDTQTRIGAGTMRADGGDIRIASSDCTVVPFWIESGLGTAATKIWMKLPSVAAGAQQIDLYYGEPSASSVSSRDAVFGPGLVSFYTFSEGGGSALADRAGANTMTLSGGGGWSSGPLPGIGAISGFADGQLRASGGGPTLGSDFTVLSMIKPTSVAGATAGVFGNYKDDATSGWSLKLQPTSGAGQFMLLTNQDGNWCQEAAGNLVPNVWQFIAARRQYGSVNSNALFQDGAFVRAFCPGDNRNVNGPGPYEIGNHQAAGEYPFPGEISISMLFARALPNAEVAALDAALRIANPPKVTLVGAPPSAPTIGVAAPNGTTASVDFTPPSDVGDGPITRFDVVCSPGGQASGASNPVVVSGLPAGQAHSCKVRAANAYGVGPWSAQSNSFVPGGAPSFGSATLAPFVVKSSGAFTIMVAGQPTPTLSLTGALPLGLSYANGVIEGTPALGTVGTYPVTLSATNGILPDASQSLTIEVSKAAQAITLAKIDNQILGPQKLAIVASASSQLAVDVVSTTPASCTVGGDEVALVATGVCTLSASQGGNGDYEAAPTVTQSFQISTIAPPEPDASVATPDASVSQRPDASAVRPDAGTNGPTPNPGAAPGSIADAIEGGGCQCDIAGGSASAGGFVFGGLGLVLGFARRFRRRRDGAQNP